MSSSVAVDPSLPASVLQPPARARRSVWLVGSTVGLIASVVTGADWFWQAIRADGGDMSQWADFPGWQVTATEIGMATLLAIVFLASAVSVQRSYRDLIDVRPLRRMILMASLVPAIAVGALLSFALPKVVGWASNQTAAAARFAAEQRAMEAQLRHHPMIPTVNGVPAPPEVTRLLLGPGDLGAGWFDFIRPTPSQGASEPLPSKWTALAAAHTAVVQAHRGVGLTWVNDQTVLESYWRFADASTATAVRDYLVRRTTGAAAHDSVVVVRVGTQVIVVRQIDGPQPAAAQPSLREIAQLAVQQVHQKR